MTPKQQKITYSIFFSFFSVWLFSMLTGFLSAGEGTAITFTSQFMLALFLSAASLAAMSSLMLGLNLLGINLRRRKALFSTEEIKELRKLSPVNGSADQNDSARAGNSANQNLADASALEKWKSEKEKDRLKSLYLFGPNGPTEFTNCQHEFGYLAEALKHQPIPDECFGCPRVVECVKSNENG
jgi:hypothetical protein